MFSVLHELDLSEEQVRVALEYINAHRDEVEAQYETILKRAGQPNPDWVEAGSAKTWDELRHRIDARSRGGNRDVADPSRSSSIPSHPELSAESPPLNVSFG